MGRQAVSGPGFFPICDVAPDGKRIVVLQPQEAADEPKGDLRVTLLVNWFDEVRRHMPARK